MQDDEKYKKIKEVLDKLHRQKENSKENLNSQTLDNNKTINNQNTNFKDKNLNFNKNNNSSNSINQNFFDTNANTNNSIEKIIFKDSSEWNLNEILKNAPLLGTDENDTFYLTPNDDEFDALSGDDIFTQEMVTTL